MNTFCHNPGRVLSCGAKENLTFKARCFLFLPQQRQLARGKQENYRKRRYSNSHNEPWTLRKQEEKKKNPRLLRLKVVARLCTDNENSKQQQKAKKLQPLILKGRKEKKTLTGKTKSLRRKPEEAWNSLPTFKGKFPPLKTEQLCSPDYLHTIMWEPQWIRGSSAERD